MYHFETDPDRTSLVIVCASMCKWVSDDLEAHSPGDQQLPAQELPPNA